MATQPDQVPDGRESKGHPQFGQDGLIVAINVEESGAPSVCRNWIGVLE